MSDVSRCGLVAIIGRPNVGKSTLLNHILEQKLSITSRKPQTTRYQILGVKTVGSAQMLFLDTPGWQRRTSDQLGRLMNRQVSNSLESVDVIVMVADARGWTNADETVAKLTEPLADRPRILVLNKHDQLAEKEKLLPVIADVSARHHFDEIIPACAERGDNIDLVMSHVIAALPEAEHLMPPDTLTDRSERFLVGEILREKLMRNLGDELPYSVSVVVERFADEPGGTEIDATIWVDRDSQKGIVIGQEGQRLRTVASSARTDIERLLGRHVYLNTWVKVKGGWKNDPVALEELGL